MGNPREEETTIAQDLRQAAEARVLGRSRRAPSWFSRPFRAAGLWGLLTQGIGLRPQPWARLSRPVGPQRPEDGKVRLVRSARTVADLEGNGKTRPFRPVGGLLTPAGHPFRPAGRSFHPAGHPFGSAGKLLTPASQH